MSNELRNKGWKSMQSLLDKEMPVAPSNKNPLYYWLLGIIAVLLIVFSALYFTSNTNESTNNERALSPEETIVTSTETTTNDSPIIQPEDVLPEEMSSINLISSNSTEINLNENSGIKSLNTNKAFGKSDLQSRQLNNSTTHQSTSKQESVSTLTSSPSNENDEITQENTVALSNSLQTAAEDWPKNDVNNAVSNEHFQEMTAAELINNSNSQTIEEVSHLPILSYSVENQLELSSNMPLKEPFASVQQSKLGTYYRVSLDKELLRWEGLLHLGLDFVIGVPVAKNIALIGGVGYKGSDVKRDYTFVNAVRVPPTSQDLRYLTRSSVVYIEDVHHLYVRAGLEITQNKLSAGAYLLPTVTLLDGGYNVALISGYEAEGISKQGQIYSINYGFGVQYQLWKKLSLGVDFFSNFKPFFDASPDQGKSHNYFNRLGANISYTF